MTDIKNITISARGLVFPTLSCGEGPLVLLQHGFPDTPHTFEFQLRALANAGYRAVAPMLRGYDPRCQSRPADYHVLRTAEDLVAMIDALGETEAHLVGHDWGAVAAYLAANLAPEKFRSIVTMAVPHPLGLSANIHRVPEQFAYSWYMYFFQVHRLAEQKVRAGNFALIEVLWRKWSKSFEPGETLEQVKEAFRKPHVVECALAYYRELFRPSSEVSLAARDLLLKPITVPVLAIAGNDDGCIRARMYDFAMTERWFQDVTVERMADVGHFMHLEAKERVTDRILAFLNAHARTTQKVQTASAHA